MTLNIINSIDTGSQKSNLDHEIANLQPTNEHVVATDLGIVLLVWRGVRGDLISHCNIVALNYNYDEVQKLGKIFTMGEQLHITKKFVGYRLMMRNAIGGANSLSLLNAIVGKSTMV